MAGQVPSIQGRNYTNRTDLQNSPTRRPPAQPTGRAPAQRVPAGTNPLGLAPPQPTPNVAVPAGGAPTPGTPAPVDYTMDAVPNLTDPSARANESVLTGMTPGFISDSAYDPLSIRLRAAYMADPDPALMEMILGLEQGGQESTNEWDGGTVPGGNRYYGVW